jgi:DNA-binding transcriptional ArsR family regulator
MRSDSREVSLRTAQPERHAPVAFPDILPAFGGPMDVTRLAENADDAAALLALLANGKRLTIIEHLLDREMSVGAIAKKVSLSQSALSQHLAKLRSLNLVETRRDRQMIYYSCNSERARRLLETLEDIFEKN